MNIFNLHCSNVIIILPTESPSQCDIQESLPERNSTLEVQDPESSISLNPSSSLQGTSVDIQWKNLQMNYLCNNDGYVAPTVVKYT